jgi:tetratricopeptide (TPR) repeat protein
MTEASMRRTIFFIVLWSACSRPSKPAVVAVTPSPAPQVAPTRGLGGFYLELAGLYERYRDLQNARNFFGQAIEGADQPAQAIEALLGLARVDEALGDRDGAIAALERALARREPAPRLRADGPPVAITLPGGDDAGERLARLYAERGRGDEAARLYEKLLAGNPDPFRRSRLLAAQVGLLKSQGRLAAQVQAREAALSAGTIDAAGLRFLAAAYDTDEKRLPVYERLIALEEDPLLRQTLLALYERSGKIDDAVALVRSAPHAAAGPAPGVADACVGASSARPPAGALAAEAEAVRLLWRAGRQDQALAATARLTGRGAHLDARVLGAQLYQEGGRLSLARAALAGAAVAARDSDEKRVVQLAQAELLARAGERAELKTLFAKWKQSDDGCLRREAERRESF